MGGHHLFVNKAPVFTLQIGEQIAIADSVDFGVVPGYGQVFDYNVVVFQTTDRQGLPARKVIGLDRIVVEFEGR